MIPLQLHLSKEDTVRQVQDKFSDLFPHLLIKIFRHTDGTAPRGCQDIMLSPEIKMIQMNSAFRDDVLLIPGGITVSALESSFFRQFGLLTEICRKNGCPVRESVPISNFLMENKMMIL